MSLNFGILKITNRIAKIGKDIKTVFEIFDNNNSNACKCFLFLLFLVDCEEIYGSCRQYLGIFFTREEVRLMTHFLDEDGSGEVDLNEF